MIDAAILVVFPLCMAVAAFSDLFSMTIPNRVSVILVVSFFIIAPLAGLGAQEIGYHLLAGLAVFAVVFVLFAINAMGGGDAKLLTASAIWFGFNYSLVTYLTQVAIVGGVLTVLVVLLRSQSALIGSVGLRLPQTFMQANKIPYGIAIAIGAFIQYPNSPLMQIVLGHAG